MLSVKIKRNKNVYILSSMHHGVGEKIKSKEEMNHHYNQTKGGVDVIDRMLGNYTTKRGTKRWTLAMFLNMIDVMALATYITVVRFLPIWHMKSVHS